MGGSRHRPPARRVIVSIAAVVASGLACGDPATTGVPILNPDVVDFGGAYSVTHRVSIVGTARSGGCSGELVLSSDFGLGFNGSLQLDAVGDCVDFGGRNGSVIGSIRGEGISFSVAGLPDPLAAVGCSMVGGDPVFLGTFTTRRFGQITRVVTLRGTRVLRAACEGEAGEFDAQWEISARRL